jgi:serine/threonine-protein kinase
MTQSSPLTASGPGAAGGTRPSLLFVDDERSILTALQVVFRRGYDVTVTTDGHEAIELLKTRRFDVVVSDQRMPAIPGIEVLRQARDFSPRTVRILLTGYSDTDAILGAINDVEVHRFLQKPWDNDRVKRVIEEAVRLARELYDAPAVPVAQGGEEMALPAPGRGVEAANDSVPASMGEKETVLVVGSGAALFDETRAEMGDAVNVERASTLDEVFRALATRPVGIIVYAFDVQSEGDRTFLQMLKRDFPFILVIAACDSTDARRLIELINQAKIFRYVRRPVSGKMLSHYIMSGVRLLDKVRANGNLLLAQQPEPMTEAVAGSATTIALSRRFAAVHKTLWDSFTSWMRRGPRGRAG